MRAAVLAMILAGCTVGDDPIEVSVDEPLPAELAEGDVIRAGDIAVEVPAAGETVTITVDEENGDSFELAITNAHDGIVTIVTNAPDDEPLVIAAGSAAPCQDGAFKLAGHRWTTQYRWKFQAGSTPGANSRDNVETGLVRAANAITGSRNSCGFADLVSATHAYLGRTTSAPNIKGGTTSVSCGARDSVNTVGFGALPSTYLGVACSWSDGNGVALEGDVKLSTRHPWYALGVPSGCTKRFGIQPVGAHEFGHIFGLGHVSESNHPNLTMSTATAPCTNAGLSLGLGDVRALRQLY